MVQFLETLVTMVLNEWIEKNVTQHSQIPDPDKSAGPQAKSKARKRPREFVDSNAAAESFGNIKLAYPALK
eukprot:12411206-Karenia_brevis.AAC.1